MISPVAESSLFLSLCFSLTFSCPLAYRNNCVPSWMNRVLLCLLLSLRAIIIRSGEVIPMSAEFTPESERQRLQFLVRKNLSQLLSSKHSCQILAELASPPVETPAMLSSVSLTRPALCASLIDYGIVFPIPRARQSSSLSVFFFLFSYHRPTCSPTY